MTETANRVMVPGYRHVPGHHCGSTALRNLLAFHGVQISEEMAFGLGAGACFYYVTLEDGSPTRWFNGRTARLEGNFSGLTGAAPGLKRSGEADGVAWRGARGGGRGGAGQGGAAAAPPSRRPPPRNGAPLPAPRGGAGGLGRGVPPPPRPGFRPAAGDAAAGAPRPRPPQQPSRLPAGRAH